MLLIIRSTLIILYNMCCMFLDFCSLVTVCFYQSLILFKNFKSLMTLADRCLHCLQRFKALAGKGASQWFYMSLVLTMTPSTTKSWLSSNNCNNLKTFLHSIEGQFPLAVDFVQVTFHLLVHLVQQVLMKVSVSSVIYVFTI